jgi:large subunit ribosomal protein L17
MRHRKKINKLGRSKSHRKATLKNLTSAIVQNQQIKTTLAKAKAARSFVEKLITIGKKDTVAARRQAFKFLQNHQLVKKLFDEIAPTFANRSGGYTRVIKLGRRKGDGAELAILQLVGFEPMIIEEKKPAEKKKKKPTPEKKEPEKEAVETKSEKVTKEPEEKVKQETKEEEAKPEVKKEKTEEEAKKDEEKTVAEKKAKPQTKKAAATKKTEEKETPKSEQAKTKSETKKKEDKSKA